MKTLIPLLFMVAAAIVAAPAQAEDQAARSAAPPRLQPETQAGMANYSMSGMSSEQKQGLATAVQRQNKQLGHGMAGLGNAVATAKVGKKGNKGKKKAHKRRIHRVAR